MDTAPFSPPSPPPSHAKNMPNHEPTPHPFLPPHITRKPLQTATSIAPPPSPPRRAASPVQALGKCARSADLDFEEAVRRALSGDYSPGSAPPPRRPDRNANHGGSGSGGDGREGAAAAAAGGGGGGGGSRRGSASSSVAEAKSEEKRGVGDDLDRRGSREGSGGGAGGAGRRGSGGGRGGGSDQMVGCVCEGGVDNCGSLEGGQVDGLRAYCTVEM